jgi:hypothetical protein
VKAAGSLADVKHIVSQGFEPEGALCDGWLSYRRDPDKTVYQVREYLETLEGFRISMFALHTNDGALYEEYGEHFPGAPRFMKLRDEECAVHQFDGDSQADATGERPWN